jgi:predicted nucleic acid-binding protein
MVALLDDAGRGPVCLDTAVFIYYIEENEKFLPLVEPVFDALDAGDIKATTSTLTLLETLVVPLRRGQTDLADEYQALLTRGRGLDLVDLDRTLLRGAAQLRATYGIKTPDALQLAAALRKSCTAFITNDRRLPALPGLPVLQLRDYLK